MKRSFYASLLGIILALVSPLPAHAGWSTGARVDKINVGVNSTAATFVSLVGVVFSGCATTSGGLLEGTDPNYRELLSTLLAAKVSDRDVQVMYTGCNGGYPVIKEVVLL